MMEFREPGEWAAGNPKSEDGVGDLPCGASTVVPVYAVTVICELAHGHDGAHHGHINAAQQAGSPHAMGPESYDW